MLSFLATRQLGIIELGGRGSSSKDAIAWGTEPVDIGTPADILLLAFNLPALIALFPLLPLTYWIESEFVLRSAWGLAAVGQWFLIGRYFDIRRGLLPTGQPSLTLWLKKTNCGRHNNLTIKRPAWTASKNVEKAREIERHPIGEGHKKDTAGSARPQRGRCGSWLGFDGVAHARSQRPLPERPMTGHGVGFEFTRKRSFNNIESTAGTVKAIEDSGKQC
jgi:hypothetical protein